MEIAKQSGLSQMLSLSTNSNVNRSIENLQAVDEDDGFDVSSGTQEVRGELDEVLNEERSAHMTDDESIFEDELCVCRNCYREGPDVDLDLTGDDSELGEYLTLAFVAVAVEEISFSRKFCLFRKVVSSQTPRVHSPSY